MESISVFGPRPRPDSYRQPSAAPVVDTRANNTETHCPCCDEIGYDAECGYCPRCGYSGVNGYDVASHRTRSSLRYVGQRCGHCGGTWPDRCLYGYNAVQRTRR